MKIVLSQSDRITLEAAKTILYQLYSGQLAINNDVMKGTDLNNAIQIIDIAIENFQED